MRAKFFGICLLLICNLAFAQANSGAEKSAVLHRLKKGQRIRVEAIQLGVSEGKFREIINDTLRLRADSSKIDAIAISDLQTLWVRTNSAREGGKAGAIIGVIPGAILGVGAGLANIDCESHCVNTTAPMLVGGSIGGLVGAASGATIGASIGAAIPQWRRMYP
jgi:hypothetical protein